MVFHALRLPGPEGDVETEAEGKQCLIAVIA